MLFYSDGGIFASSCTPYQDSYEGRPGNRICITVKFGDLPATTAIVDTGAPYCVLSREQIVATHPNYKYEAIGEVTLQMAGILPHGVIVRWPITLLAEKGQDLTIEGIVFVPDDDVNIPNFVGLDGCLSRIRFGVDAQKNMFFFGPVEM